MNRVLVLAVFSLLLASCAHHGKKHDHKGGHHHKMWKMMDADNNGDVTKEEFDKAHSEMFKKMDANSDGKVTKEEKMAFKKSKMKEHCKGGKHGHKKGKGCCK